MTSMISDETLQKIEDKLEELSHKIKALEILKLSMSSLENQSPNFTKNLGVIGNLVVGGTSTLSGGVAITGSATVGGQDILTTASNLDINVYGSANANAATILSNDDVLFTNPITVANGVEISSLTGKITLPAGGLFLININFTLDPAAANQSTSVALINGATTVVEIISASKTSASASVVTGNSISIDLYIRNLDTSNSFQHLGGYISIIRVDTA